MSIHSSLNGIQENPIIAFLQNTLCVAVILLHIQALLEHYP